MAQGQSSAPYAQEVFFHSWKKIIQKFILESTTKTSLIHYLFRKMPMRGASLHPLPLRNLCEALCFWLYAETFHAFALPSWSCEDSVCPSHRRRAGTIWGDQLFQDHSHSCTRDQVTQWSQKVSAFSFPSLQSVNHIKQFCQFCNCEFIATCLITRFCWHLEKPLGFPICLWDATPSTFILPQVELQNF